MIVAAALVLVIGWWVTLAHPDATFVWSRNLISDLGASTCHDRDARWVCSPRHLVFNTSSVVSGALLLLGASLVSTTVGTALALCFVSMGAGLIIIGSFPADVATDVHLSGAILALPGAGIGMLVSGRRITTPWLSRRQRLRFGAALVVLLVSAPHLLPPSAGYPKGPSEYLAFMLLLGVTVLEGFRLARHPDAGTVAGT